MVFSSPVVAKSHYEGKVHAKNVRKTNTTRSVGTADTQHVTVERQSHVVCYLMDVILGRFSGYDAPHGSPRNSCRGQNTPHGESGNKGKCRLTYTGGRPERSRQVLQAVYRLVQQATNGPAALQRPQAPAQTGTAGETQQPW